MSTEHGIKANQAFLSWCKKNGGRIKRGIEEHTREYFFVDRSLAAETKFWAGAREHGGQFTDLTDQELDLMIEEELHDLRHYVGEKIRRRKVNPSAFKS